MPHRQPPASRTFASGTRSADRSDRPGLPWSGYRAPAARSSVAGHRSPRKPAATRDHEPTRRADAPPDRVLSASSSSRLPIPLSGTARKEEGENPARSTRLGRGHRAGGVTPVEQNTGPAVKTSNPRLPPRDAKRAVGGIRAWGENPGRRASSPTTVLQWQRLPARSSKSSAETKTPPRAAPGSRSARWPSAPASRSRRSRATSAARVTPSLERLLALIAACGLEPTFGLARADDSYDDQTAVALALTPAQRLERALRDAQPLRVTRAQAAGAPAPAPADNARRARSARTSRHPVRADRRARRGAGRRPDPAEQTAVRSAD